MPYTIPCPGKQLYSLMFMITEEICVEIITVPLFSAFSYFYVVYPSADRLQRLAEKVHREIKQTEITLEEVEIRIEDEARRVERLHPMDAKRNCDALDGELAQCEDTIKTLHSDVKVLRDGKYHEAPTLHKRCVRPWRLRGVEEAIPTPVEHWLI